MLKTKHCIFLGKNGTLTVKFNADKVTYTTKIKNVKNWNTIKVGDIRDVKWTDDQYYPARIIALSEYKHLIY